MRILLRSNGNTPRTYEKQFRLDGSNAAWPFEHLPKHALAWWRSPSDLPCSLTATGSICRLNPDTASGHTVAETYAAPLRRVLRSGLAMLARKRLSGILSQQKEKFGSLQRGEIKCFGYAQVSPSFSFALSLSKMKSAILTICVALALCLLWGQMIVKAVIEALRRKD